MVITRYTQDDLDLIEMRPYDEPGVLHVHDRFLATLKRIGGKYQEGRVTLDELEHCEGLTAEAVGRLVHDLHMHGTAFAEIVDDMGTPVLSFSTCMDFPRDLPDGVIDLALHRAMRSKPVSAPSGLDSGVPF